MDDKLQRIKKAIEPHVNKWFYRWSFEFIEDELSFWRRDLPTMTSSTMNNKAFNEVDFKEDVKTLAFYINWLNSKYPLETHDTNRQKIMERRKWARRYGR